MHKSNLAPFKKLEKQLSGLKRVRGGVLGNQKYEDGTSVLEIAFVQEYGAMLNGALIPARSFIRSTFDENYQKYSSIIKTQISKGMPVLNILEIIGVLVAGDIQTKIATIQNPPLSKKTIEKRRNKTSKPLVDSGLLLSSISYEVYNVNI